MPDGESPPDLRKQLSGLRSSLDRIRELGPEVARVQKLVEAVRQDVKTVNKDVRRAAKELGDELRADLAMLQRDVRALERRALLDLDGTPYPQRLTLQRYGLLSQNEEDGILAHLVAETGRETGRCVEIGCGSNGGNTGMLVGELGYHGLMFDAEQHNVDAVRRRFPPAHLTAVQAWVDRDTVDGLVTEHGFAGDIDVLSIDIDGNDIWVWERLTAVRPRIAVIEFNSFYGPDRAVAVPYRADFSRRDVEGTRRLYYGASLAALAEMGRRKGMRLVTTDGRGVNAFFLRDDLAPHIPACEPRQTWRMLDKDERHAEEGIDIFTLAAELGLPLEELA